MILCSLRKLVIFVSAAGSAVLFLASAHRLGAAEVTPEAKPNSNFRGVQVGLNVPYSLGNRAMGPDEILEACVKLGLSGVELRSQPVESFLGVPAELLSPKLAAAKGEAAATAVPVDPVAAQQRIEALSKWRAAVAMDQVEAFRRKYESAGVRIEILKVDGVFKLPEADLDYFFTMAKSLGARAISTEISHQDADLERVGRIADKHQLMVGYHGHASTKPEHWERAFALAKYNGANVDLGHFVAGNNISPVEFIKKYHDRITHVHVKDRKFNNGPNAQFGDADTPIGEVLRLIRDNRWPIQATIEFEYGVPKNSTRMDELARAIQYCRGALGQ